MSSPFSILCEGLATQCRKGDICHFGDCPINEELVQHYGNILPLCEWASTDAWVAAITKMFPAHQCQCGGGCSCLSAPNTVGDILERVKEATTTRGVLYEQIPTDVGNCCIRS